MDDEQIAGLRALAEAWRAADRKATQARSALNAHIQKLKRGGAGFAELAATSGLAQGTIQNIVAQDPADISHWRRRCQRRKQGVGNCDEIWPRNIPEWCPVCSEMADKFGINNK